MNSSSFFHVSINRTILEFGVAARIRRAFFRRLRASLIILDDGGKQRTLDLIAEFSSLSSIRSDENFVDMALQIPTREERAIAERFASQSSTKWKCEIAILASINRMLIKIEAARQPAGSPDTDGRAERVDSHWHQCRICLSPICVFA